MRGKSLKDDSEIVGELKVCSSFVVNLIKLNKFRTANFVFRVHLEYTQ